MKLSFTSISLLILAITLLPTHAQDSNQMQTPNHPVKQTLYRPNLPHINQYLKIKLHNNIKLQDKLTQTNRILQLILKTKIINQILLQTMLIILHLLWIKQIHQLQHRNLMKLNSTAFFIKFPCELTSSKWSATWIRINSRAHHQNVVWDDIRVIKRIRE